MKDYYFYHAYNSIDKNMQANGTVECEHKTNPAEVVKSIRSEITKDTETDGKKWIFEAFNFLTTI